MRFKILSVMFVFILIFVIFAAGDKPQNPKAKMKITGNGFERIVKVDKTKTEDDLIKMFKDNNTMLEEHFDKKKFSDIGKYFGKEGIIWTDEGEIFEGVDNISNYFKSLKATKIKFKTKYVIIHELTEELKKPKEKQTPNDVVDRIYEFIDFSFNSPGGGSGVAGGDHIRACIRH